MPKLTQSPLTSGLREELDILHKYAPGLEFDDLPDYEGLQNFFRCNLR